MAEEFSEAILGVADRFGVEIEQVEGAEIAEVLLGEEVLDLVGGAAAEVEDAGPLSSFGLAADLPANHVAEVVDAVAVREDGRGFEKGIVDGPGEKGIRPRRSSASSCSPFRSPRHIPRACGRCGRVKGEQRTSG